MRQANIVSVPLRGLWFLSLKAFLILSYRHQFPSPCGDYGSYLLLGYALPGRHTPGFRPLAGIMVLISTSLLPQQGLCRKVSVPLRGLWFLSATWYFTIFGSWSGSFRPLAGIMVLIRTLYKWLYEAVEMAFCGADHIFSSFFVFCKKMIFKKLLKTEF